MRVWNKPLREINGKDALKLYVLFGLYRIVDKTATRFIDRLIFGGDSK